MGLTLHERVALKRDLQEHRLRAGDVAYLVDFVPHPESGEEGGVIEVFNAIGDSIAVLTVPLWIPRARTGRAEFRGQPACGHRAGGCGQTTGRL